MFSALPRYCGLIAALLLPAGCAPAPPPAPQATLLPAAGAADAHGVIVAARPPPPRGGAAGDMRATVLAALGAGTAAAASGPGTEFIVRDDTGRTVSVVQDNPQRLGPGDRVAIRRAGGMEEGRTELVRAAAGPAVAAAGG